MEYPYIQRSISKRLKGLFDHFSCIVLSGARQVGKSTLLTHLFPDLPCIVFDPIQDIQNARSDPDLFLDNNPAPIILDEIQYAPELIPALKRRIDKNKKPGQYWLTGSQQWGVLNEITESLAGRAMLTNLDGFSISEIAQQANDTPWLGQWLSDPEAFINARPARLPQTRTLVEQIWRGFLPEANFINLNFVADYHASYQRTYIERDIRQMSDIADLQQFGRFVKLAAAMTAQEINYSEFGRDIGVTPQTAKRWLNILSQAFEWFEIPAYSNNIIKRVSLKPKGYFSDTGQICYSQMISSPQAIPSHPMWGSIFENAVVSELRKQCLLIPSPPKMHHWRIHSGAKCDLVLERDGRFFPIEIKSTSRPNKNAAKGLNAFRQKHPALNCQKGLIIAPAEEMYPVTSMDYVIPWDIGTT